MVEDRGLNVRLFSPFRQCRQIDAPRPHAADEVSRPNVDEAHVRRSDGSGSGSGTHAREAADASPLHAPPELRELMKGKSS